MVCPAGRPRSEATGPCSVATCCHVVPGVTWTEVPWGVTPWMEVHGAGGLAATTQTGPWPLELGNAGVAGFAGPWSLAWGAAGGFGLGDGCAHPPPASGNDEAAAART